MGARGDIPGRPAPSEELLDEGQTDPKEGSHGALRAEPLITGAENLLSQVKGVCFHAHEYNAVLPYIQSRTAIVVGRLGSRLRRCHGLVASWASRVRRRAIVARCTSLSAAATCW